jgi:hypothetical protein
MISEPLLVPSEAFLLASSDYDWLEALQLELEAAGEKVVASSSLSSGVKALEDDRLQIRAIIVDSHMRLDRLGTLPVGPVAFARAIRAAGSDLPILFLSTVPFEEGALFAKEFPPGQVILDEHVQSDRLGRIREALGFLQARPRQATHASVDIELGASRLTLIVRYEPDGKQLRQEIEWRGDCRLVGWADYFRVWTPYRRDDRGLRETDNWQQLFELIGKTLLEEIPITTLTRELASDIGDQEKIHFRFNISARNEQLAHLPFELIQHPDRVSFMRQISPIARRLILEPEQLIRRMGSLSKDHFGSVLCVFSDVEGVFSVPSCTFGNDKKKRFGHLKGLEEEWQAINGAYSNSSTKCEKLDLTSNDPIGDLERALEPGYDIVHYSGHSIRADNGEVFLVLPEGRNVGQLEKLRIRDFADMASRAGARLVILSSCESSSVDAIARLAQYGISSVIGFRWEVLDSASKIFTSHLYKKLAAHEPLARAFLLALKEIMQREVNTPTFASPVLMLQDNWV